jgi:hypothetical protein
LIDGGISSHFGVGRPNHCLFALTGFVPVLEFDLKLMEAISGSAALEATGGSYRHSIVQVAERMI